MNMSHRREFSRVRAQPGHYASFPGGVAPILHVGIDGVTLEDSEAMRFDSLVRLRLHLGADTIDCNGKVTGSDPETGIVKIQFADLTTATRKALTNYLVQAKMLENRARLSTGVEGATRDRAGATDPRSFGSRAPGRTKLEETIVRSGLVDTDGLAIAIAHQREHGGLLPLILASFQVVAEDDLASCLHQEYRLPLIDLATVEPTGEALRLVPLAIARRHAILPIGLSGSTLTVAVADPTNADGLAAVKFRSGCELRVAIAPARSLLAAIDRFYEERARATG
jgi:hypothetical protein